MERASEIVVSAAAQGIRDLFPGYFAFVMATGIVSIAAQFLDVVPLARVLFPINLAAYAILCLLTLLRLLKFPRPLLRDLVSHTRGPGFLTLVAATCIVGSQFVILAQDLTAGWIFWLVGLTLWLILMYTFFTAMTVHEPKPDLEAGLHGGWLITVVSTQSVSVLGTMIASQGATAEQLVRLVALIMYLLGCTLYILVISLIFYRLTFFTLTPEEFTPPYWINMGAIAITTLAGSLIILSAPHWDFVQQIQPFLIGFTLFFWATGTWWIPLLVILEAWRHLYKRYPLYYHPRYWDIAFPLGMYTTCTFELARVTNLSLLLPIPHVLIYVTLVVWLVVFLSLLHRLWIKLIVFPVNTARTTRRHRARQL